MLSDHIFLSSLWILYCVAHNFLANHAIKDNINNILRIAENTYRVLYNLFALLTLVCLLVSHFSVATLLLYKHTYFTQVSSFLFIFTGAVIMLICIVKYFKQLSGLGTSKGVNEASVLETSGIHTYVRHPLYLGTFIFLLGLFLWAPLLSNLIAVLIIIIYTIIGIRIEEQKLLAQFGKEYKDYQHNVPMLMPFLKNN